MNYLSLVNRVKQLDKTYIPTDLVDAGSKYKDNILVNNTVYKLFILMRLEALRNGYDIDIMSGYRSYNYQDKLYTKLVSDRGLNYAFRCIAPPGCSEHQTGLAIDICVYRGNNCYIEHELEELDEMKWLHNNCYRFGFILRYPHGKEDITGYNYEPWHFRYVGNMAGYLYFNDLSLEEYVKKTCKH